MKEQLNSLKENTAKLIKEKEDFKKQRNFFNMKVEEQKNILNIEEIYNTADDSYERANILNIYYPEISYIVDMIKKEHPKYGNKKIKGLILEQIKDSTDISDITETLLDNYFLYESCGYHTLKNKENEIQELEKTIKQDASCVYGKSKESIKKFGSSVANTVKPYGDIAKNQINNIANKGSKKLIKVLEKIKDKTENK